MPLEIDREIPSAGLGASTPSDVSTAPTPSLIATGNTPHVLTVDEPRCPKTGSGLLVHRIKRSVKRLRRRWVRCMR
jgi:hypothetical protein